MNDIAEAKREQRNFSNTKNDAQKLDQEQNKKNCTRRGEVRRGERKI